MLDENAKEQAIRTSSMPFVVPHLALMPDAHLVKGAPTTTGRWTSARTSSYLDDLSELAEQAGGRPGPSNAKHWMLELGSLGSGNHFIEVTADESDAVWLFLHSG